jgi:hypothetical protein
MYFEHVSFGVETFENAEQKQIFEKELNGWFRQGGSSKAFRVCGYFFPNKCFIEFIAPNEESESNFLRRFLRVGGPRIHHVTFKLSSLQEFLQAAEEAKGLGFEVVGYSQRTSEWGEFFLFPKSSMGIVVQFLLAARFSRNYPTDFEFKPPVVHFKGLYLVCRDGERAKQLWGKLCRGACTQKGEFLEFSWEGTGMKIYVKVDPTVKVEGPLKLEFYNETSKELLTVTSKLGLLRAKL